MNNKVFVTGIGIISSIGKNVDQTLQSIQSHQSGLGKIKYVTTIHQNYLTVGEVKYSNDELIALALGTPNQLYTRTSLLGMLAAKEAYDDAKLSSSPELKTGIVSATSVGGMGIAENHFLEFLDEEIKSEHIDYIKNLDCSDQTEQIAKYLGISDFLSTISTACSSSANSIMFGARLIKNNILDRVIVGGTDSLSRFTINGFNCLKILDPNPCRPFDVSRSGLNLGEGAGFLVLESEKAAGKKKIYCELSGYGNTNDAYHQTASSPEGEGAKMAIEKALRISKLKAGDISYINAHGTGTEINDLSEGIAIQKIFEDAIPPLSSTKAFTGHTLAAAGGVEAVLSVLAIERGMIYPNLNFKSAMTELNFTPEIKFANNKNIKHVLSNSFGFGGNTSSLIFSKI